MTKLLGRAERIDITAFGLKNIPAKVDTGAYSSSIDFCYAQQDGDYLEFVLLHPETAGYSGEKLRTKNFDTTEVTNANGTQTRFVIFADVTIHGEELPMRLTLADRSNLRYPVLVGRKFINQANYLVDVSIGQGLPDDEEERGL